jgi:hypothetical protein
MLGKALAYYTVYNMARGPATHKVLKPLMAEGFGGPT